MYENGFNETEEEREPRLFQNTLSCNQGMERSVQRKIYLQQSSFLMSRKRKHKSKVEIFTYESHLKSRNRGSKVESS